MSSKDLIELKKITPKKILKTIKNDEGFRPENFGIKTNMKGSGMTAIIVGTGLPEHKSIKEFQDIEVLAGDCKTPDDKVGHSTMMTGILSGDKLSPIKGLIPSASMIHAKAFTDILLTDYATVVAALLLSSIKKADVVLLPFPIEIEDDLIKESIEKCRENGTVIISAKPKKGIRKLKTAYPELIFVEKKQSETFRLGYKSQVLNVALPKTKTYSTYLDNVYAEIPKDLLALSVAGGLTLLAKQSVKKSGKEATLEEIMNKAIDMSL